MNPDQPFRSSHSGQWVVIAVTILVSALFGLGLPRLAEATQPEDTTVASGERVERQGVSVEVAAGWILQGDTPLVVLDKGTAKFLLFPPVADTTTPTDAVTADSVVLTGVTLGEVIPFTTESGLTGASVTYTDASGFTTMLFAYSDGTNLARGQVSASSDEWDAIESEIESMLGTLEITGVPSS